jgi:hypothetical protein
MQLKPDHVFANPAEKHGSGPRLAKGFNQTGAQNPRGNWDPTYGGTGKPPLSFTVESCNAFTSYRFADGAPTHSLWSEVAS